MKSYSGGRLYASCKCRDCEFEIDDSINGQKLAGIHAAKFRHLVHVHVAYLKIYDGRGYDLPTKREAK